MRYYEVRITDEYMGNYETKYIIRTTDLDELRSFLTKHDKEHIKNDH